MDYKKIVPNKMDVGTVKDKLKNARYPHVEAFFGDLLRVYQNAVKYYEKNGMLRNKLIYKAAKVPHALFPSLSLRGSLVEKPILARV